MTQPTIDFESVPWETLAEGARHKVAEQSGKRVRLLEVTDRFVEADWCTKAHVAYVLEGRLRLELESGMSDLNAGDAFILQGGESGRHKARALIRDASPGA